MPRLGCGEVHFQECLLGPAVALCLCFHKPPCAPSRDRVIAYLLKTGVDLDEDFSLTLDADGNEDVVLLFGGLPSLQAFKAAVDGLAATYGA